MIVNVQRTGAENNSSQLKFCHRLLFLVYIKKLLHQDSLQQSAEIWNQYFEGSAMCQVLKISAHKYSREAQRVKTESFSPQLSLTTHFLLHILKFSGAFLKIWSQESFRGVLSACSVTIDRTTVNRTALTHFHNTNLKFHTAHGEINTKNYIHGPKRLLCFSQRMEGKADPKHIKSLCFSFVAISKTFFTFVQRKHNRKDCTKLAPAWPEKHQKQMFGNRIMLSYRILK